MSLLYVASRLRRLWAHVYQRCFPAPFRIISSIAALWRIPASWAAITVTPSRQEMDRGAQSEGIMLTEAFVKDICNEHFRLMTHLTQLENLPNPPRPVRRLRTVAESLQRTFEQQGIEYCDLTGQDYHEGRRDFDNFAPAAVDPTLTTPKIVACEYPAVFLRGKLIQTARGIVARPATS